MTAATVALSAAAIHQVPKPYSSGLVGVYMTQAIATTSLDDVGDIVELGYLPENCTVVGFMVSATDMDTGSAALVFKLTLGAVDVVTGLTNGQAGTSTVNACVPQVLTARTKLQMNVTVVAATAAAGTVYVTALYVNQ